MVLLTVLCHGYVAVRIERFQNVSRWCFLIRVSVPRTSRD